MVHAVEIFFRNISVLCNKKRPCLLLLAKTKADSLNRFKCLSMLGFDGLACVPSVGRSGGLSRRGRRVC